MGFDTTKHNYQSGRKIIEGRTFQIEFWDEQFMEDINLPWCRICEIKLEERPIHFFSRKTKMQEVEYELYHFWSYNNRLEMAMDYINNYLKKEKIKKEELRQIETFCEENNYDR